MGVMDESNMRSLKKPAEVNFTDSMPNWGPEFASSLRLGLENNGHGPVDFGLDISLRVARWLGG